MDRPPHGLQRRLPRHRQVPHLPGRRHGRHQRRRRLALRPRRPRVQGPGGALQGSHGGLRRHPPLRAPRPAPARSRPPTPSRGGAPGRARGRGGEIERGPNACVCRDRRLFDR